MVYNGCKASRSLESAASALGLDCSMFLDNTNCGQIDAMVYILATTIHSYSSTKKTELQSPNHDA